MGRASVIPRTAQNQNRGKVEKLNPIPPGLFESGAAWGGGGGGGCPRPITLKLLMIMK